MNVEGINRGAYTVFGVPLQHVADFEQITTKLPALDLWANKEKVIQHNEIEALVLNGSLLRVDISGFSSLNDRLTSISPFEPVPKRLTAFSLLNASRHQEALVYEDIAHQLAYLEANAGQQSLIDRFNAQFIAIEKVVAQYGGRILNIEGDAVNVYFPYIPEEFSDSGGSGIVHQRTITAGLEIQKLFPEESDLRARVGIRHTAVNEQALMAAGKLVYLTGKPFKELTSFEAGTTVGGVGTNLFDAGLLPAEVFYPDQNVDIWIRDAHLDGTQATLNPELVNKWEYGGINPFKKAKMHDGLFIAEVDPDTFIPAKPIDPRRVSFEPAELDALLERFTRFNKKSIETSQNVPVIVSYFAVGNIVKNTIAETLTNIAELDHFLAEIEKQHSVQMLKTGIDSHGNVTLIALHTGNRNGSNGEPGEIAMVNAMLEIEKYLKESTVMRLSGAGIVSGTGVLTEMGAQFYRKDDIMGMVVTGAARIEQLIDREQGRIAIDMATLGRLRALGYEPLGKEKPLDGVKGFPAGLPIFYLNGIDKAQESETLLKDNTFKGFKKNIKDWLKKHQLKRNDLAEVFRLVQTYCGIHGDDLTEFNTDILRVILYPLLEDLRSDETLFRIHHTLAAESIKSSGLQKELEKMLEKYGESVYLAAAMTGGSNLPFNQETLQMVASQLHIPIDEYLQYLKEHNLCDYDESKGQITIWPALQRRAYLHLTKQDQKINYHKAIFQQLNQNINKNDFGSYKSLVFHAMQAKQYETANMYLPQIIENCKQDNDWEGIVLYGEWLAQAAKETNKTHLIANALLQQGYAYLEFGDNALARTAFLAVLNTQGEIDLNMKYKAQLELALFSRDVKTIRKIQKDFDRGLSNDELVLRDRNETELAVRSLFHEARIVASSRKTLKNKKDRKNVENKLQSAFENNILRDHYTDLWLLIANTYTNLTDNSSIINDTLAFLMQKLDCDKYSSLFKQIKKKHPNYADMVASLIINRITYEETIMPFEEKMELFDYAILFARRSGNFKRFLYALNNRSDQIMIKEGVSGSEEVKKDLEQGVGIAQAMENSEFEAYLSGNLGCWYLLVDDLDHAKSELKRAYTIFRNTNNQEGMKTIRKDVKAVREKQRKKDTRQIIAEIKVKAA